MRHCGAGRLLVISGDGVLEVDDDGVGPGGSGLGEPVGPVAGDVKIASIHRCSPWLGPFPPARAHTAGVTACPTLLLGGSPSTAGSRCYVDVPSLRSIP